MRVEGQQSVPRSITRLVVRTLDMSPFEARRWYRQANPEFGGRTPEAVASTLDGTRQLVAWLDALDLAAAGR